MTISGAARTQFQALLTQHWGIVLKVAYSYGRSGEDRDDLAQEIALHLASSSGCATPVVAASPTRWMKTAWVKAFNGRSAPWPSLNNLLAIDPSLFICKLGVTTRVRPYGVLPFCLA